MSVYELFERLSYICITLDVTDRGLASSRSSSGDRISRSSRWTTPPNRGRSTRSVAQQFRISSYTASGQPWHIPM